MNFLLSGGTYKPLRACRRPSSARISAIFKDLPHGDYARIGEAVDHDCVAVCAVPCCSTTRRIPGSAKASS